MHRVNVDVGVDVVDVIVADELMPFITIWSDAGL